MNEFPLKDTGQEQPGHSWQTGTRKARGLSSEFDQGIQDGLESLQLIPKRQAPQRNFPASKLIGELIAGSMENFQ
tara:strand:+ start:675 stop:899 length:225 start_codon:yes stop_codon:yes gene_type:complete